MLLVATALFTVFGLFLGPVSTSAPQALNCSPVGCIVSVTTDLAGIIITLAALLAIYRGLKRAEYIYPSKRLPPLEPRSVPGEARIIAIANPRMLE